VTGVRLEQLREVQGVEGSFALSSEGELLVTDMPSHLQLERLEAAAESVLNILQAGADALTDCESLSCRFGDRLLEVILLDFGCLCVLATHTVDRRLLAVVMRMVAKRVAAFAGSGP
jgi:predicted regulator of Ras-like GTPase activity (Roadblock/LC7/MglB family)